MYTVTVSDGGFKGCEKEYKRKANAIKSARAVLEKGYVYFDNSELWKWQRKVIAKTVTITDDNGNQIEF